MGAATLEHETTKKDRPRIRSAGFFALRTPLLPFDEFLAWSEGLAAPGAGDDLQKLEQALAYDRTKLREYLLREIGRPEVREALFVASPSLDESLAMWRESPDSERGQKVERALVRYFTRMSCRPTPFGLFAGCSVGKIDSRTCLCVSARSTYRRHTRPDMDYLTLVIGELNRDPVIGGSFLHRPNSSLYQAADRFRYVESRFDGKVRSHHLSAVEPTDYLSATLERAKDGAHLNQLARALREADAELTEEDTTEYIQALVENQILVSDLSLAVTGAEPVHTLISQLQAIPEGGKSARVLEQARDALARLDSAGLGNASQDYLAIAKALEALPAKVELPKLFQVDMDKPAPEATLGGKVLRELERAVEIFHRLTPRRGQRPLQQFREAFTKRYESREVPLVEVLDEEAGIGFQASNAPAAEASPLLADLAFPPGIEEDGSWTSRDLFLLNRLEEVLRAGSQELELSEEDLKELEAKERLPLPDAFSVMAVVLARSPEALKRDEFRLVVSGADGPSGGKLLGRFCHGDASLAEWVRRHLREEEAFRPDAVFAEIIHLPEGRIGNVLLRPAVREYEIPYLGKSGVPVDRQIPVTDLMISVLGDRIRLRSSRLGREVIPRMTNAHNYSTRSLGLYRFLCALQHQGVAAGLGWIWGPLEGAGFLPRVTMGRLILSRARWHIRGKRFKALGEAKGAQRFREVQRLRKEMGLPRLIVVADADNTLPVDLDNILSVETFVHLVKGRNQVRLEEAFSDELCAFGPEGRFTHELVVPFVREGQAVVSQIQPAAAGHSVARSFAPGSEWLYAKLFTGTSSADQVLREVVGPVVRSAMSGNVIDRWFFIRYGDPDWHVRLRCHGPPNRLRGEVQPALESAVAPLLEDGRIWRFQLDTYEREVERYGGPDGIALAEEIFHLDSEAVLQIVELLSGDEGTDARWRLTLRGMDMLLNDLGFDLKAKLAVLRQVRESFGREFRADGNFERQLGNKYRKERASLESLLDLKNDGASNLAPGLEILSARSQRMAPLVAKLKSLEAEKRLTASISSLASSYLHMHANRLLRSAARAQELVIYDFLTRTYESQQARARKPGAET